MPPGARSASRGLSWMAMLAALSGLCKRKQLHNDRFRSSVKLLISLTADLSLLPVLLLAFDWL